MSKRNSKQPDGWNVTRAAMVVIVAALLMIFVTMTFDLLPRAQAEELVPPDVIEEVMTEGEAEPDEPKKDGRFSKAWKYFWDEDGSEIAKEIDEQLAARAAALDQREAAIEQDELLLSGRLGEVEASAESLEKEKAELIHMRTALRLCVQNAVGGD